MTRIVFALGLFITLELQALAGGTNGDADRYEIGQHIIVGFFGTKKSDRGFNQTLRELEDGVVGGVLFLGRNVSNKADLGEMVRAVRQCRCRAAPLVAIDEEGGAIERLGEKLGYDPTPSAAVIGRSSLRSARVEFGKIAQKLSELGFNLNLAPVVDVNVNPRNPIIGSLDRSFSNKPDEVTKYAAVFVEEHRRRRIGTVLKHFPGHGSSTTDSHLAVSDVQNSWSQVELEPYRTLIGRRLVDAIMIGHLANKAVWGGVGTQNGSSVINEMLRGSLKFKGVTVSDDLSMKAIREGSDSFEHAIVSAVQGGVDLVIVTRINDDEETADIGRYVNSAILSGLIQGQLDRKALGLSSGRIQRLKRRFAG